jgi:hypothetical protein
MEERVTFRKEIIGNELYLFNSKGELIFKRWLDQGRSVVFDIATYDKNTLVSITDDYLAERGIDPNAQGWWTNIKYVGAGEGPKNGAVNVGRADIRWDLDSDNKLRVWVESDNEQSNVIKVDLGK